MKLPCVICGTEYDVEDIGRKILITTGVCTICYSTGLQQPARQWCFGKLFDRDSGICRVCPDRIICHLVFTKKVTLV